MILLYDLVADDNDMIHMSLKIGSHVRIQDSLQDDLLRNLM